MTEPPTTGPAGHVLVRQVEHDTASTPWRRRGLHIAIGVLLIAAVSWRFGFTVAGAALTLGALAFLAHPSTRLRLSNSVRAQRHDMWVSGPALLDGDAALLTIDEVGLGIVRGATMTDPHDVVPWSNVSAVELAGPVGRPEHLTIHGEDAISIAGPFGRSLIDRLIAFGAQLGDSAGGR